MIFQTKVMLIVNITSDDTDNFDIPKQSRTYTIEEAVEAYGMGWFQFRVVIICGVLQVCVIKIKNNMRLTY